MAQDLNTMFDLTELPEDARITDVNIEPAHGGIILNWSYNIDTSKMNCSGWQNFREVYTWEEEEKAFDRVKELFAYRVEQFKAKNGKKKDNPGHGMKETKSKTY